MSKKNPTYEVNLMENSIHLEPTNAAAQIAGASDKPQKMIYHRAEVYRWPNEKIDVLFADKKELRRAPTLTELASFPFCRIMHSKRRVNMIISFGKAEAEIVERQMILDRDQWFEAIAHERTETDATADKV